MKAVKNTNLPIKLAGAFICIALVAYLVIYAVQSFDNPYQTVQALTATVRDSVHIRGVVARQEEVLDSAYNTVYITAREGRRVSGGSQIAEAFDSENGLQQAVRIGELQERIAGLEAQQSRWSAAEDIQALDTEVAECCARLRSAAAARDCGTLEEVSMELQMLTFTAFGDAADVAAKLRDYRQELAELQRRADSRSATITSPRSGLFSTAVDGWEDLDPADLGKMGPEALGALLREERSPEGTALGKLVYGNRWYFAAVMESADALRLRVNGTVGIHYGRYYSRELRMRVESISDEENGKRAVLFSCASNMTDVLSMRQQEAELIFSVEEGLRIPRKALHVDASGRPFVYVLTALQAEAKPVELMYDYGDYYVVSSEDLRPGDEIIVSGRGLFDGKVVE